MLLEMIGVKKYFPVKRSAGKGPHWVKAVDQVDLAVASGENLGLVGESGSGKTTLGRLILKLYPVDAGRILLQGQDITRLSPRRMRPYRKHVQMVFQDPHSSLDPRYTIRNILRESFFVEKRQYSFSHMEQKMAEILMTVGLSPDHLGRFPHEFSGGERQRIAIARALIMNPSLLILDEAVSSLDVLIQDQILALLEDLQKRFQTTYLFISHNLRIVKRICQRIAVMYQGKIVEVAPVKELFQNPLHPYTQRLLSSALHYKVSEQDSALISFSEKSRLIDRGKGHFVID